MRAPIGDRAILLLTLVLTVHIDLTVAIGVGVVLAALMFMHRMAEVSALRNRVPLDDEDDSTLSDTAAHRTHLPSGVEVFELRGPLFFGVADHLLDLLRQTGPQPKAYVIDLRDVPLVDATGATALRDFADRCHRRDIAVFVALRTPLASSLTSMHALPHENITTADSLDAAIDRAAAAAEQRSR
jgi:SulP family sulfate permease